MKDRILKALKILKAYLVIGADDLPQGKDHRYSTPLWPDKAEREQYAEDIKAQEAGKIPEHVLKRIIRYEMLYTRKRDK